MNQVYLTQLKKIEKAMIFIINLKEFVSRKTKLSTIKITQAYPTMTIT